MEKIEVKPFVIKEEDEIIKEMVDNFNHCPKAVALAKKLRLDNKRIIDEIAYLSEYADNVNYCANCPGIENCAKDNPTFVTEIKIKDGQIIRTYVPCETQLKRYKIQNAFLCSDFPFEVFDQTLRTIDKTDKRNIVIQRYRDFIKNMNNNWIYISGPSKSGKTFFTATLCVDAASRGKGLISFVNCKQRFEDIGTEFFRDKEEFERDLLDIASSKILVLDGLGEEIKTSIARNEILLRILKIRDKNNLFTIITSKTPLANLKSLYATNKTSEKEANQIAKIIAKRCGSDINLGDLIIYR